LTHINLKLCDGSDANETAVKIARKHTGRPTIISFKHGHTGQTTQTIQLRGYHRDPKLLIGNTEDVIFVDPPECADPTDYAGTVEELERIIRNRSSIAGILMDPMMVNAGVRVNEGTRSYLRQVEQLCRKAGIIFILDENQSFGWLEGIFATNYFGLNPDILTLGKGLAGGYPLAGVIVRESLKDVLSYNEADFTNGGNPTSCAAAYACMDTLQRIDFAIGSKMKCVTEKIQHIRSCSPIQFVHRGVGLIHCLEITEGGHAESKRIADQLYRACLQNGLFLRQYGNKLIIKPPIIVTYDEIDTAFQILYRQFAGVARADAGKRQ